MLCKRGLSHCLLLRCLQNVPSRQAAQALPQALDGIGGRAGSGDGEHVQGSAHLVHNGLAPRLLQFEVLHGLEKHDLPPKLLRSLLVRVRDLGLPVQQGATLGPQPGRALRQPALRCLAGRGGGLLERGEEPCLHGRQGLGGEPLAQADVQRHEPALGGVPGHLTGLQPAAVVLEVLHEAAQDLAEARRAGRTVAQEVETTLGGLVLEVANDLLVEQHLHVSVEGAPLPRLLDVGAQKSRQQVSPLRAQQLRHAPLGSRRLHHLIRDQPSQGGRGVMLQLQMFGLTLHERLQRIQNLSFVADAALAQPPQHLAAHTNGKVRVAAQASLQATSDDGWPIRLSQPRQSFACKSLQLQIL
mmetsp:Transcript_83674/g.213067  ORF Transcript_83674/g.213067 Transcript_83674/m.213067 type:complete len:357 (+) Transcript_83674:145-1215(+)